MSESVACRLGAVLCRVLTVTSFYRCHYVFVFIHINCVSVAISMCSDCENAIELCVCDSHAYYLFVSERFSSNTVEQNSGVFFSIC